MIYEAYRHFNEMFKALWADSGLLLTGPNLLFLLLLISMNQSSTLMHAKVSHPYAKVSHLHAKVSLPHAKVSHLHAKVSLLHAKVSHLHAKVSLPHAKVSHLHAKVSLPHAKVSHLHGIVLNFFKISTLKITWVFIRRA
jgi:hypothetical protein